MSKTIVLLGPTCTGKTTLAIKLCQRFHTSLISADSRQVVKYMDIGTGKMPVGGSVNKVEKQSEYWIINGIKIYGYDLVNPDEYFSAYDFLDYFSRHRQPFLVGGTGFYIDVVTGRAVLEGGAPDMELRVELARLRVEELSDRLLALNKSVHQKTDLKNPARLIRAIEKAVGTKSEPQPPKMTIDPVFIGLTAERNVLYSRADNWVEEIFAEPLFAEVRQLHMRFPRSHRLQGLIYKSAVDYLTGMATLADAKQQAKFDMHAYIRRQQTYFKRNREIKWFDVLRKDFDGEVTSLVESLLDGQRDFYLN